MLSTVAADLTSSLLPQPAREGLLGLGARLPELDNSRYLELRLGAGSAGQVDYLMSLTQGQAQELAQALPEPSSPGMEAVRRLAEHWPSAALREVPAAWLEFDDVVRQADPAASICLCVAPSYRDPYARLPARPAAEVLDTITHGVRAVQERDLGLDERMLLQRCLESLPAQASWIHLSMMTARNPLELKLYGVFPGGTLLRYLQDVGWPGTFTTFSRFLHRYHSSVRDGESVYLDLPLAGFDDNRSAGLGVCFSQQQLRRGGQRITGDPFRTSLLEALIRDGMCTSAQVAALKEWMRGPAAGLAPAIDRWLDIKLVYHDARAPLAKAYLGFARRRASFAGISPSSPAPTAVG